MKALLAFILLSFAYPHEYHVGIYNIAFKGEEVQVSQKLFSDDFEMALYKKGKRIHIGDDLSEDAVSKAMQAYIREHFSIRVDNEKVPLDYVGTEWDDDLHSIYLYWKGKISTAEVRNVEISNTIFLEVSPDQQNMHYLLYNGIKKDLLLETGKTTGLIRFD